MNHGPQYTAQLKESFMRAASQTNLNQLESISNLMQQRGITLTPMEQIRVLQYVGNHEPELGKAILKNHLIGHAVTIVGYTCLKGFTAQADENPIEVPLLEQELKNAIKENRVDDAKLIIRYGKWCIKADVIIKAQEKLQKIEYAATNSRAYLPYANRPSQVSLPISPSSNGKPFSFKPQ